MEITKRLHDNIKLLEYLKTFFIENPNLRFNQVLEILNDSKDYFYEEPEDTLKRWIRKWNLIKK